MEERRQMNRTTRESGGQDAARDAARDRRRPLAATGSERPVPTSVLFVALAVGLGGSTRSLLTVLARLESHVHRVFVGPATGKVPSLIRDRHLAEAHVTLWRPRRRAMHRFSRPVAAARLAVWLWRNRRQIAAIHANGPEELNIVLPGASLTRVPVVVWSHARDVSPWMRRLAPLWRGLMRRRPVRWSAVSPTARDVLVRGGLTRREEVAIIPNPIDPMDVQATSRHISERVVIGYLGSDARYKGFQFLPDVVDRLRDLPVRWAVFSEPRSKDNAATWERLRAMSPELLWLAGKHADVRSAYAQCDIVFCPSLEESFCRVAAEAMLNSIPVVASDLEPVRNLLGDGAAGLVFPPGDTVRAAECLRELIGDARRRRSLGSLGLARARSFAPDAVVGQLRDLYGVRDLAS
jgi:glycosyltransferase involved in cell wall biosynthesis